MLNFNLQEKMGEKKQTSAVRPVVKYDFSLKINMGCLSFCFCFSRSKSSLKVTF